jgi:hypothetical protein
MPQQAFNIVWKSGDNIGKYGWKMCEVDKLDMLLNEVGWKYSGCRLTLFMPSSTFLI